MCLVHNPLTQNLYMSLDCHFYPAGNVAGNFDTGEQDVPFVSSTTLPPHMCMREELGTLTSLGKAIVD